MYIKDFAKLAEPLNHLTRKGNLFIWGPEQDKSMSDLKDALRNSVPLGNIDYKSDGAVILGVDTLYQAVGFYIDSTFTKKMQMMRQRRPLKSLHQ